MKKWILILILMSLIVFPIVPLLPLAMKGTSFSSHLEKGSEQVDSTTVTDNSGNNPTTPAINLALANYTSNHIDNPNLEYWFEPNSLYDWTDLASQHHYQWFAQTPWPVHEGSYSVGVQTRTPYEEASYSYWRQYGLSFDMGDLNLTLRYYIDKNEVPASDYSYVRLELNAGGTTRYMYYWLNGTMPGSYSNGTHAYFTLTEPSGQWNRFCRNITDDYIEAGLPGPITSSYHVTEIRLWTQCSGDSSGFVRSFFDDVHFINESNAYVWMGGSTLDGNFESGSGNPWSSRGDADAGSFYQSSVSKRGDWSANMTAISNGNYSYSYMSNVPDVRVTSQNHGILSFWWRLNYQNAAQNSDSYLYMYCRNATHNFYTYYYLGYGGTLPRTNDSNGLVYRADGYNTMGSWVLFQRDIWEDAGAYFGTEEVYVSQIYFYTRAHSADAVTTTLVDDFSFVSRAINDGDYEDQRAAGNEIRGWTAFQNTYFRVTSSAYSGSKAANFSLPGYTSVTREQVLNDRPFNGTRETYLDVMWRLEDFPTVTSDRVYLEVQLNGSKTLYYYFAATQFTIGNGSGQAVYNLTGSGSTGSWRWMHRSLKQDYEAVIGTMMPHEIQRIYLRGYNNGPNKIELLLDDLWLYDDPAPQITNTDHTPSSPEHNQAVTVTTDVTDGEVDTALLFYRLDGGGWNEVTMTETASYSAGIPAQPWDTEVEYYIVANDTWSKTTTDNNSGTYYRYVVADTSPPQLNNLAQNTTAPMYTAGVNVSIDAWDDQSKIFSVNLSYRVDGGGWTELAMTNGSGISYWRIIPAQPWNSFVEYYIRCFNGWEVSTNEPTSGYESYTVGDNVDPIVYISDPGYGNTVSGTVVPTFAVGDLGSGLAFVEFYVNDTLLLNDSSYPYAISWDSTAHPDGNYILRITAHDRAGNSASDTVPVTVNNYVPPPPLSPLLIGGIIAVIVIVGVILLWFFRYRKPK